MVYLHRGDRIGIAGFPRPVIDAVTALIKMEFEPGVRNVKDKEGITEVKLVGMPCESDRQGLLRALFMSKSVVVRPAGWHGRQEDQNVV